MDLTEVDKNELLSHLKENRAAHEKEFKKAKRKWTAKAKKALRAAADEAAKNGKINETPLKDLPKPVHYLASYDTMIQRLEFEVKDTVELDDREFQSYVLDNWQWKNQFVGTTSFYNG